MSRGDGDAGAGGAPPTDAEEPLRPRSWRPSPFLAVSALLHAAGAGALLALPRGRRAIAALLVADHAALVLAGLAPRSRLLGPTLVRLERAAAERGHVALTFDDGPDPEVTPRVLDLLDRHGAQGSFFAVGELVERHPGLAAEIAARGHRVENHSHRHRESFWFLPPAALGEEIDRAQEAIAEATGRRPLYFRAPAGIRSPLLEPALARRGLHLAAWTRRGYDTVRGDATAVHRALVRDLAAGDVLLLHDGHSARTRVVGRPVVLEVLPRLLASLAERGLRGVALPSKETG